MKSLIAATSMAIALFASTGASAAEQAGATLRVESGQVMTSSGGEFTSAQSGTVLNVGDRVMLADGSSASVDYPGGCQVSFSSPGVYAVQPASACTPTQGDAAQGFDVQGAAIIAGAGAVAIGVLANEPQDTTAQPVSR